MYPLFYPMYPMYPMYPILGYITWTVSWDISTLRHRVAQKVARSIKVAQVAHFEPFIFSLFKGKGGPLGATLGATGATGATLCGTSLFLQYLRIFSFWDTEPGILNDTLNDSSFAPTCG